MFKIVTQLVNKLLSPSDLYAKIYALSEQAGGGKPKLVDVDYRKLDIPSKSLIIGDIMYPGTLQVNELSPAAKISIQSLKYPGNTENVTRVQLKFEEHVTPDHSAQIGETPVDSAKIIIVDKEYYTRDWMETGRDRIGIVSVLSNNNAAKLIASKFKLKLEPYRFVAFRIKGEVSEQLEQEITDYLESIPEFKERSFLYFSVESNNSFNRLCFREEPYGHVPVGLNPDHQLFFTTTGLGDGCYPLIAHYYQSRVVELSITFIGQEEIQEIVH